jgi:hypothetical protein
LELHRTKENGRRDEVMATIAQFLKRDEENQTNYLDLKNDGYWWFWYGGDVESHAWYLKLLSAVKPQAKETRGLVKYLVNNRKHASYWNSTRDTAYAIEAIAAYLKASGELAPEMEVEVMLDGKSLRKISINRDNLFAFDGTITVDAAGLATGAHEIELKRSGKGALYANAYLEVFSLEDFLPKAGLEVKVERHVYKLVPEDQSTAVPDSTGLVVTQKVEKFPTSERAGRHLADSRVRAAVAVGARRAPRPRARFAWGRGFGERDSGGAPPSVGVVGAVVAAASTESGWTGVRHLGGGAPGGGSIAGGAATLAAVATSGSAADLTGTLSDARLSNAIVSSQHMSGSVVDVIPRFAATSQLGMVSGITWWTFFTPQKTITVSQISMATQGNAASGLTLAKFGLYTFDETTATLVAKTTSDTALFNASYSVFTKSFDGSPANYTLNAGTRYAVAVLLVGTTMPTLVAANIPSAMPTITPRMHGWRSGQSDLLSTNTSFSVASGNPIWARLS